MAKKVIPAILHVTVQYTLTDDDELKIEYNADNRQSHTGEFNQPQLF